MNFKDKRVKYTVLVLAVLVAVIGLRIYNNVSANREKAQKASRVRVTAVMIDKPKRQDIKPVVKLTGTLDPVWQADVGPKVEGRIEKVFVDVGSVVRAGDVMAELEAHALKGTADSAAGNVYDARAALGLAERELERAKRLYEVGGKSKSELDSAQATYDAAIGKVESASGLYDNALSRLEGTEIRAPHDGVIIKRYYQEGYYCKDSTPVFKIADTSALTVKVDIPEGQIGYVDNNVKIEIEVPAMDKKRLAAAITKLSPVADLPARTFAAEVTVDNSANALRGGLFANVYIYTKEKKNALTIPQKAVIMREDQRTVFVVGEDDRVVRRVLNTGYIGGDVVEVLGGINENDRIVIAGQNRIKEGSLVKNGEIEAEKDDKDGK